MNYLPIVNLFIRSIREYNSLRNKKNHNNFLTRCNFIWDMGLTSLRVILNILTGISKQLMFGLEPQYQCSKKKESDLKFLKKTENS